MLALSDVALYTPVESLSIVCVTRPLSLIGGGLLLIVKSPPVRLLTQFLDHSSVW